MSAADAGPMADLDADIERWNADDLSDLERLRIKLWREKGV